MQDGRRLGPLTVATGTAQETREVLGIGGIEIGPPNEGFGSGTAL